MLLDKVCAASWEVSCSTFALFRERQTLQATEQPLLRRLRRNPPVAGDFNFRLRLERSPLLRVASGVDSLSTASFKIWMASQVWGNFSRLEVPLEEDTDHARRRLTAMCKYRLPGMITKLDSYQFLLVTSLDKPG